MIQMIINYLQKLKSNKNKYLKELIRKEIEELQYKEQNIKSPYKSGKPTVNYNEYTTSTYEELISIINNLTKLPNAFINKNMDEISIGLEDMNPYSMYSIYITKDDIMRYTMGDGNTSVSSNIYCKDLFKKVNDELKEFLEKRNQDNFQKIKNGMYKKYNLNRYDNLKTLQDYNKKIKENDNKRIDN